MLDIENEARQSIRALRPQECETALAAARAMARQVEFLDWSDRSRTLSDYFWAAARSSLSSEDVTAVVNRHLKAEDLEHPSIVFGQFHRAVMTAALILLAEKPLVTNFDQAFTLLFSAREGESRAAALWLAGRDERAMKQHLATLPGYAFLLLIVYPSDCAESFLARDAFWTSMLGHG